jgi:glycosyltransferase involved in cell wall biosynthesis
MNVVQLLASPFLGGPERQTLGLACSLPPSYRTTFLSFWESGRCRPLLDEARRCGFEAVALEGNYPRLWRAAGEVAGHLKRLRASVLCCSGYKPDLVGWLAARRAGVPVVAVAHGWTGATWRVRLWEALDAFAMRLMDATVCVSEAMAVKVRRAGVPPRKAVVIRNAVSDDAFTERDPSARAWLEGLFPARPALLVGAAGRLSPEKGFEKLIEAAAIVTQALPGVAFVLFGEGPLRQELTKQIAERHLQGRFVLGGFRSDLGRLWPALDLAALSSYTEGLPVAVLEAMAASVPVVATAVGGTPEVIEEGVSGQLVAAGDAAALAGRMLGLLRDDAGRRAMGRRAQMRVRAHFSFAVQAEQYQRLFQRLIGRRAGGVGQPLRFHGPASSRETADRMRGQRRPSMNAHP